MYMDLGRLSFQLMSVNAVGVSVSEYMRATMCVHTLDRIKVSAFDNL